MEKGLFLKRDFSSIFFGISIACLLSGSLNSCTVIKGKLSITPDRPNETVPFSHPANTSWLSWNIMFSPNANDATRTQQINTVTDYIKNYLAAYNLKPLYIPIYCPCDSSLFNLNAIPVDGSGQSLQAPPPPPKPPGGSGDNIPYVVSINNNLNIDMLSGNPNDPNDTIPYYVNNNLKFLLNNNIGIDTSKKLAIMDTGLDPDRFDSKFNQLLWSAPGGKTLRNFFAFNSTTFSSDYYMDNNTSKHGTAVAMIALQSMDPVPIYPKIMVLKVLDAAEKGTTFNVGCALSYAIQNHATVVNASLGYYDSTGISDPVLSHYLGLCNTTWPSDSIYVFAAAGNLPLPHNRDSLCGIITPQANELVSGTQAIRLFYPACFNDSLHNVISVTGLKNMSQSCVYQNYSHKYVSLGVLNPSATTTCCQFHLSVLNLGFEGSSFATPVASGKVMGRLLTGSATLGVTGTSVRQSLNFVTNANSSLFSVTRDGKFINGANVQ
jgi:hypothetical protein